LSEDTKGPDRAAASEIRVEYDRVMGALTPCERRLAQARFGTGTDAATLSLEELQRRYEETRKRIEEIEEKALRRMRRPPR
jgi:RNA polymerase primary sigma factor